MNPWIIASRPKTLPAAISPVVLGIALAYHVDGSVQLFVGFCTLLAAILIQIGTNLANDAYDFLSGADNSNRIGPTRVTSDGLLSSEQVIKGMWIVFSLSILVGCYLAYIGKWPIVAIGLISILSGIAYTGGPYPLGYNGLGDITVFIFFGLIATFGTIYLQNVSYSFLLDYFYEILLVAIASGCLNTAILVINNI